MMRRLVALILIVLVGACGDDATADREESLEHFIDRHIGALSDEEWGRYFDSVHPAQQALFDREEFIACAATSGAGEVPRFDDIRIVEQVEDTLEVPGTDTAITTTAATLEVDLGDETDSATFHFAKVDDEWYGFLTDPTVFQC